MAKRIRDQEKSQPSQKRRKITKGSSATYGTVARTRGIYSINSEMKYFDGHLAANLTGSNVWSNAGCVHNPSTALTLCAPTQGAGINQRIGKEIHVHKIRIQGTIQLPPLSSSITNGVRSQNFRLILVQDMQTNATQFLAADLMDSSTTIGYLNAFQNYNNFGRFRVLKDKYMVIEDPNVSFDGTNIESGTLIRRFKFSIRFQKPVRVRFNGTNGGTIADIVDNSFTLLVNNYNYGSPQVVPEIEYRSRIVYSDA